MLLKSLHKCQVEQSRSVEIYFLEYDISYIYSLYTKLKRLRLLV